jgi:hypothetical protein
MRVALAEDEQAVLRKFYLSRKGTSRRGQDGLQYGCGKLGSEQPRRPSTYLQASHVLPANRRKSGEGGIRTHETASNRLRDFQSRSFGQLGHLS